MANLIRTRRKNKHEKEQAEISSQWSSIASNLNRETERLLNYTAWKNDNYINNGESGLVDTEDMVYLNEEATLLFQSIQQNMAKLQDIFNIPVRAFATPESPDKVLLKEDNDAFIAKWNVDVVAWDRRYN